MIFAVKQLISFILPLIVLILVPLALEPEFLVASLPALITGLLVMLAGLTVIALTIFRFIIIGKGTLAPWFPTGKLVVTGLYKYVRNPMIIGVLIVLLGESIAVLSIKILIWMLLFFLINHLFFLLYEEPNLEKRFGDEYRSYKKRVPRWIPGKLKTER